MKSQSSAIGTQQGFRQSTVALGVLALLGLIGTGSFIAGRASRPQETPKAEPIAYNITIGEEKKDQAGAVYLKIGKTLLAIGDEESAIKFIEKAVLTEGPSQKEASELLEKTLAARAPVAGSQAPAYSSSMSPAEVVKGYLAATKWQERLPFVMDPKRVGPLMAIHYQNTRLPGGTKPGTILPLKPADLKVGDKVTITVDASESEPQEPFWRYVVVRTSEGHKVDWEASQALFASAREEAQRRSLQLENPVVEVKLLKLQQAKAGGGKYATVHLEVTNRSNKLLTFCDVGVDVYGRDKKYLAKDNTLLTDLKSGETQTLRMMVDVDGAEISAWKPTLRWVRVNAGGRQVVDVTKYYQVKEKR